MRTVLVPVEAHSYLRSVLQSAFLLAQTFDSYIEGFALGPDIANLYAADAVMVAPPIFDQDDRREMAAQARHAFEGFMHEHRIPERFGEPTGACFGWQGDVLRGDAFVGDLARAFDIAVVGRPASSDASPRQTTLEQILFESGRPILVAPPLPPATMGNNVVIAWNGSTETARAISLAMPLLHKAEKITVLTVKNATVPGPIGEQIARTLRINGIPAQALYVEDEGRQAGETILTVAKDVGADLLVKGAYTQSRLRQMIFGGPTRYLLEHATLPMIMAH